MKYLLRTLSLIGIAIGLFGLLIAVILITMIWTGDGWHSAIFGW